MKRIDVERAVLPHAVVAPASILVDDDGLVTAAGRPAEVGEAPGAEVVDRRALTAVPGLVDLQVNGGAGVDVRTADADGWRRLSAHLLTGGVTAWCPTVISTTEPYDEVLGRVASGSEAVEAVGPHVLGVHLEGPFLAPDWRGAHPRDALRHPDVGWAADLAAGSAVPVVMWTVAPELPGAVDVIRTLAASGVVVSAGHTGATFDEMVDAVDAGLSAVTHLFNRMSPLDHREPGVVGAALALTDLQVGLILDGVHVHEEVAAAVLRAMPGRAFAVSDSVAGPGRRPDGTLAGSNITLDDAFRRAVRHLGLERAVELTATIPAATVGRTDLGEIRPGAHADLVLLDDTLEVRETWIAGRLTG